ncbi:MAG: sel1 repeat family protein [Clostridia bacterium]|nr:sel1 repeat family protein [Clostridia bacterium]
MEEKKINNINYIIINTSEIQNLIEENKFEELAELLRIHDITDFESISDEDKGKAYYSLGQILSNNNTNDKEKRIIYNFKIKKNLEKAVMCYWKAVDCGNILSSRRLFRIHTNEHESFVDYKKAELACQCGVKAGDILCRYYLGELYYQNKCGYKQNIKFYKETAKKLFEVSVEENPTWGGYELGRIYEYGECGCPIDLEKSFYYYLNAADCGERLAMLRIARIYGSKDLSQKFGVEFDKESSIYYFNEYLKIARPEKMDDARTNVGMLKHEYGTTNKEKSEGIKKVFRSAKKGNELAKQYLEQQNIGSVDEPKEFDLSFMQNN